MPYPLAPVRYSTAKAMAAHPRLGLTRYRAMPLACTRDYPPPALVAANIPNQVSTWVHVRARFASYGRYAWRFELVLYKLDSWFIWEMVILKDMPRFGAPPPRSRALVNAPAPKRLRVHWTSCPRAPRPRRRLILPTVLPTPTLEERYERFRQAHDSDSAYSWTRFSEPLQSNRGGM